MMANIIAGGLAAVVVFAAALYKIPHTGKK